jgi:hypothetical protein
VIIYVYVNNSSFWSGLRGVVSSYVEILRLLSFLIILLIVRAAADVLGQTLTPSIRIHIPLTSSSDPLSRKGVLLG